MTRWREDDVEASNLLHQSLDLVLGRRCGDRTGHALFHHVGVDVHLCELEDGERMGKAERVFIPPETRIYPLRQRSGGFEEVCRW